MLVESHSTYLCFSMVPSGLEFGETLFGEVCGDEAGLQQVLKEDCVMFPVLWLSDSVMLRKKIQHQCLISTWKFTNSPQTVRYSTQIFQSSLECYWLNACAAFAATRPNFNLSLSRWHYAGTSKISHTCYQYDRHDCFSRANCWQSCFVVTSFLSVCCQKTATHRSIMSWTIVKIRIRMKYHCVEFI